MLKSVYERRAARRRFDMLMSRYAHIREEQRAADARGDTRVASVCAAKDITRDFTSVAAVGAHMLERRSGDGGVDDSR